MAASYIRKRQRGLQARRINRRRDRPHAAAVGRPVNTAQVSRARYVDCVGDLASLLWRRLDEGTLLVVMDPYVGWLGHWLSPRLQDHCRRFAGEVGGLACTLDWDRLAASGLAKPFQR